MQKRVWWKYLLGVVLALVVGAYLRYWAALMLPVDFDEPIYLRAGQDYAALIEARDWQGIRDYAYNYEHPPFFKLVYGATLTTRPPIEDMEGRLIAPLEYARRIDADEVVTFVQTRMVSVLLGTLSVLLVALVDPLAGFFLAVHTYAIKYSAQIYLEALPLLTSTVVVLAYIRSKRRWNGWLAISALALGLTAASKYLYCVVAFPVLIDWALAVIGERRSKDQVPHPLLRIAGMIGWGLLGVGVFVLADPYLWQSGTERLGESLFFSVLYSQGAHVAESGYPFFQPFVWLLMPVPWHPIAIYTALDGFTTILACFGVPRMWKERRVIVLWWVLGMLFLLVWSTKWPQYILIVTVPVTLCAAEGARQVWAWIPDSVRKRSTA